MHDNMNDYMGDSHIGDVILQDIQKWSGAKQEEINSAARKIRNQMKSKLEETTPVQDYPYNNGVVMQITVHRHGDTPAVKETAFLLFEYIPFTEQHCIHILHFLILASFDEKYVV